MNHTCHVTRLSQGVGCARCGDVLRRSRTAAPAVVVDAGACAIGFLHRRLHLVRSRDYRALQLLKLTSMAPGRSVAEMVGDGTSHRLRYAANARSGWAVSVHSVDAGHPPLRRHSRGVTVGAPLGSMRHDRGVTHSPPTSSDKESASGAEEDAARHRGEQVASMLYEHRREEKH